MSATVLICLSLVMSDGDSGRCRTADGENHRLRLQGVDAGEVAPYTRCRQSPNVWACSALAREWGDDAARRARQLTVNGARCSVVDRDRYRRSVVVCTVNGRDLGRILVQEGLAISERAFGDPFRPDEDRARRAGRGMWQ